MAKYVDKNFYARADAHINLSNDQLDDAGEGKVSASMLYATARFNVWVRAKDCDSGAELAKDRRAILDYFVEQYRLMLAEHLDDYIEHFNKYMGEAGG